MRTEQPPHHVHKYLSPLLHRETGAGGRRKCIQVPARLLAGEVAHLLLPQCLRLRRLLHEIFGSLYVDWGVVQIVILDCFPLLKELYDKLELYHSRLSADDLKVGPKEQKSHAARRRGQQPAEYVPRSWT